METLIVTAISTLAFGVLISLFLVGRNTFATGSNLVELQQIARVTMERIVNELSQSPSDKVRIETNTSKAVGNIIQFKTPVVTTDSSDAHYQIAGTVYLPDGSIRWGADGIYNKNVRYLVPTANFSSANQGRLIRLVEKVAPSEGGGGGCTNCPPRECFLAGTSILMQDNTTKPIEKIKLGDMVKSADEKGKIVANKVTKLYIHPKTKGYLLVETSDARQLKVTQEHRVFSAGEYKPIGSLPIESQLSLFKEGKLVKTFITAIRKINTLQTVYNFEVENTHTYFAEGILVHNRKPIIDPDPPPPPTETKNLKRGMGFKALVKKFFSGLAFAAGSGLGSASDYNIKVIADSVSKIEFAGFRSDGSTTNEYPAYVKITVTATRRTILGQQTNFPLQTTLKFRN